MEDKRTDEQQIDEKPMTKQDMLDAFNQLIPQLAAAIGAKFEPRFSAIELAIRNLEAAIEERPTKDASRKIIREKLDKNLASETFKLVRMK